MFAKVDASLIVQMKYNTNTVAYFSELCKEIFYVSIFLFNEYFSGKRLEINDDISLLITS